MSADLSADEALNPTLLRRLARLHLVTRRRPDGAPAGNRIGKRRGVSLELADHRRYADGDDLRFLDWSVLARHDQPFIRRYHEEQAVPVHLLLDRSASMAVGQPAKLAVAARLVEALAFVALSGDAELSVHAFSRDPTAPLGPLRGRRRLPVVRAHLEAVSASGVSDLGAAVHAVARRGRAGLAIVVSDFLFAGGFEEPIARLAHARQTVFAIRTVAAEEDEPEAHGDLSLVDAETGESRGVTLTPSLLAHYRRLHRAHDEALAAAVETRGGGFARHRTDADLTTFLLETLPGAGLLA